MATVFELDQQRTFSTDGKVLTATAVFQVEGESDGSLALEAAGVPRCRQGLIAGDPHPTDPRLRVDSKTVTERLAPDVYRVTVQYSSNRSFVFANKPPAVVPDENRSYWYFGVRRDNLTIPTFEKRKIVAPVLGGGNTTKEEYVRVDYQRSLVTPTLTCVVYVPEFRFEDAQSISRQADKVHEFPDSTRWRFEGGFPSYKSTDLVEITYTWSQRPDFLFSYATSTPVGLIWPPLTLPLRFNESYFVRPSQTPDGMPTIEITPVLDASQVNGWEYLPGNPFR